MKKLAGIILMTTVLFCLVSCGKKKEASPQEITTITNDATRETTPEIIPATTDVDTDKYEETMQERVSGCYRMLGVANEDGVETVIHIQSLGGLLLIENSVLYDGSLSEFWAQEIWPDDMEELNSKEIDSIRGSNQVFSAQYTQGEYWDGTMDIILTPTENGIKLIDTDGDYSYEKEYERIEDEGYFHADLEEFKARFFEKELSLPEHLVGTWVSKKDGYAHAAWLSLDATGQLTYALKEKGAPITVLFGAWGIDKDDFLHINAEQFGNGQMPFTYELVYSGDENQIQLLDIGGDMFPLPPVIEAQFKKVDETWTFEDVLKYSIAPGSAGPTDGSGPEAAMDILRSYTELEGCFNAGMVMMPTGDSEYILDEDCMVIALGTDHEENFVREYLFAVAPSGQAYVYDVLGDAWITISEYGGF